LRTLESAADEKRVRRVSEGGFESTHKVREAEAHKPSQILASYRLRQVGFNVRGQPAYLPRRQAATNLGWNVSSGVLQLRGRTNRRRTGEQHRASLPHAFLGRFVPAPHPASNGLYQLRDRCQYPTGGQRICGSREVLMQLRSSSRDVLRMRQGMSEVRLYHQSLQSMHINLPIPNINRGIDAIGRVAICLS